MRRGPMAGMPPAPDPRPSHPESRPDEEWIGSRDLGHWRTAAGRWLVALLDRLWDSSSGARRWALANLALVLTAVVGLGLMWMFSSAAAEVYEDVAADDGIAALDQPVLDQMLAMRTPEANTWITHFTDAGGKVWSPVVALVLTVALVALWRRWTPVLVMALGTLGSLALTVLGKDLVARARPPLALAVPPYEYSASFPSGHTLNTTVVLGLVAYLLIIRVNNAFARVVVIAVAGALAFAMGLSRVYLGHHWLTDVMAGWMLGLGWIFTVITAHRLWVTVRRRRDAPVRDVTDTEAVSVTPRTGEQAG